MSTGSTPVPQAGNIAPRTPCFDRNLPLQVSLCARFRFCAKEFETCQDVLNGEPANQAGSEIPDRDQIKECDAPPVPVALKSAV